MEAPPIRILQRPCPIAVKNDSDSLRPPTTLKTLEQREADYAAARRRIMGSETSEQDGGESNSAILSTKVTTAVDISVGNAVPCFGSALANNNVTVTATPLMSIQATPNSVGGLKSDFRISVGANPCLSVGTGQSRNMAHCSRQVSATCVPKPQQQLQSVLNGARPASQQPQRILAGSNSSPSLFTHSRPAQPVPLFPAQVSSNPNTGLLPTPPGFNYPSQNVVTNDSGIGLHHSHSTAVSLMQHFGLLQQQYQQPLNGYHHLLAPFSHTGIPLNPLNFAVTPLSSTHQKHAHQSTFN